MKSSFSTVYRWLREHSGLIALLVAGVLIRLLIAPFSLHVDPTYGGDLVILSSRASWFFFQPDAEKLQQLWYPPLFYISLGLFQSLFIEGAWSGSQSLFLESPHVFRLLTLLKLWYLFFDIGIVLVLWQLYRPGRKRFLLGLLWLFNPIIIYNAYFHGQFDVVPVFFLTLGLYFAKKEKVGQSAFWFGIAACYKTFPLILLLPAALILAKTWRKRLQLLLLGTLPYVALMLPFISKYQTAPQGYSNLFLKVSYTLGADSQVYIFITLFAALLWYIQQRKVHGYDALWRTSLAILLVYYQFSYFDLHYWAWIVPFAAIYWVERPGEATPFYLAIGLGLLVLSVPAPLGRFLAPVSPRFFLRLPSLLEVLNPYLPMTFILNVVRSLLAGTAFYLAYRLLRDAPVSRSDMLVVTSKPAITS